jgi:hypothetical protein
MSMRQGNERKTWRSLQDVEAGRKSVVEYACMLKGGRAE